MLISVEPNEGIEENDKHDNHKRGKNIGTRKVVVKQNTYTLFTEPNNEAHAR